MGAVDLVIQVESPTSVARGLQRIGRAGHQVDAPSRGVIFPKYRGDLLEAAVVAERMHAGAIEATSVPRNPLDVLAQQIVAMTVMDRWTVDELLRAVTRAMPYEIARPRGVRGRPRRCSPERTHPTSSPSSRRGIVWDRVTGVVEGRRDARVVAVTSGGTIPDRGLFGVFLVGEPGTPGRRVGELDEEMVYESRVGEIITLGASSLADRGDLARPGRRHARARRSRASSRSGTATPSVGRSSSAGRSARSSPRSRRISAAARADGRRSSPGSASATTSIRWRPRTSSPTSRTSATWPAPCRPTGGSWSSGSGTSSATGGCAC